MSEPTQTPKPRPYIIIEKNPQIGNLPTIVQAGHRQLEKSSPSPLRQLGTLITTYLIPVDLLKLSLPDHLCKDVSSIEFHYRNNTDVKKEDEAT